LTVPRKRGRRYPKGVALDAYLTFAIFAGVGLATWKLDQLLRLTMLWLALLALTLAYASGKRIQVAYGFSDIGRGALAGLLISLPVFLLARDFLLVTAQRLFPVDTTLTLFWGLILVMPPIEALYFRVFLQREKGLWAAVLLYAAAAAVYFMPSTFWGYLPVLAALVGGMGLLGFVYSYIRTLYGFGASLACQGIVHFVLFILPFLPQEFSRLLT
jgi:membrane protease YdiL (CAAX protease family)